MGQKGTNSAQSNVHHPIHGTDHFYKSNKTKQQAQAAATMFLGEFTHGLDDKGRLTIPAKFREQVERGIVVTRSPMDRCLLLFPMLEWEKLAAKVSALPLTDPRSAQLRRAFFSAAEDLIPDKQGRILISQRLRDFAQIEAEITVAGVNTFIELWQPTLWNDKVVQPLNSGEFDQEFFAALNI